MIDCFPSKPINIITRQVDIPKSIQPKAFIIPLVLIDFDA